MELIMVEASQLTELIDTVRELREAMKELLSSSKPTQPTQEDFITREQAMEYLHITSPNKFIIARKRYNMNCRKVGKRKLFKRSDIDKILEANGNCIDTSDLTQKEIENSLYRNL